MSNCVTKKIREPVKRVEHEDLQGAVSMLRNAAIPRRAKRRALIEAACIFFLDFEFVTKDGQVKIVSSR